MEKLGKYFFRLFSVLNRRDLKLVGFGTNYGRWYLPSGIPWGSQFYCAGVGLDISFETELLQNHGEVAVHLYDPTPGSINHVKQLIEAYQENIPYLINDGISRHPLDKERCYYPSLSKNQYKRMDFSSVGWSNKNEKKKFFVPNGNMISYSTEKSNKNYKEFDCIDTGQYLKNKKVDVIKMDIEGSEFEVIESLARHNVIPGILMFEIHIFSMRHVWKILDLIWFLLRRRYKCYFADGDNYGFIRSS